MDDYFQIINKRESSTGNKRLFQGGPFEVSKKIAREFGCDIAVPNGSGIGNVIIFSRLIEEFSRGIGRALSILTAPINPLVGRVDGEIDYPIWKHNPFIDRIVNCNKAEGLIEIINSDQDNCCQFSHIIENICLSYNLRPRILRPSLFLSEKEKRWGLNRLGKFKRPLICIHAGGTSSPKLGSVWFRENWETLISRLSGIGGIIQVGKYDLDQKKLHVECIKTTIRELFSIIWASDIFIGFDSAPAHIATGFEKPTAVLWDVTRKNLIEEPFERGFGPSALTRWSYPQNKNLMLLGEKGKEIIKLLQGFVDDAVRSLKY